MSFPLIRSMMLAAVLAASIQSAAAQDSPHAFLQEASTEPRRGGSVRASPAVALNEPLRAAVAREAARLALSTDGSVTAGLQPSSPERRRSWIGRHPVLFGTLVGFVAGYLIGYLPGDDAVLDDFNASFNGLVIGGIGAGSGAIVGGVVGASRRGP